MRKKAALWAGVLLWTVSLSIAHAEESLQEKIDGAPANATITLENQTYEGNLVIKKPITIKGKGNTIIRGDRTGNVIEIESPNVHLDQLKVEHGSKSMNSGEEYAGVKVNSSNNLIENIEITDSYHGLFLKNAHSNLVRNVKVKGEVGREGGLDIAHQGNGIQLVHSNENKVENCNVDGARDGIYVFYSDKNELTGNRVQNTRYGVHYMYAHYNSFRNNHFTQNEGGAAIMIARGTKLEGNEFSFHNSSQSFGVLLQSAQETVMTDNKFYRNLRGLYIDDANNGFIKGNQFSNTQVGVEIWSSANEQVFTENQFFHNTVPVIRLGAGKSNQWSKDGKGNFWGAEFPLFDLDQNGVGDNPVQYSSSLYKLVSENELIYLFINSPALGIYEKMNELLQNQEVMFEDPYPLIRENKGTNAGSSWIIFLLLLLLASSYYRWGRKKA